MEGGSEQSAPAAEEDRRARVRKRLHHGLFVGGALLVLVYAGLVMSAGGANLIRQLSSLNPKLLILPLLATFLSYLSMSLSYEGIARAAGSVMRSSDMLRITFVANTANYVFPSGGLSGFALRLIMFTRKGISTGRAVLISFTQTLLTNLTLMIFIVYGLTHLMLTQKLARGSLIITLAVIIALVIFLGGALYLVYHRRGRTRALGVGRRMVDWTLAKTGHLERYGKRVDRLFVHIDDGMEFFASKPTAMIAPLLWILLDWVLTVGVLYGAFYSIGRPVDYSQVAVGFSVGIVLTIISFVPAGAGILETSMAAAFASMGIPLAESVLPIFIFRVCFYVIPALLSLLFARSAFTEVDTAVAEDLL